MYECHSQKIAGYYLKSQSDMVRLISCLPKSNKGMKDDSLIASGAWHDGLHYLVQIGKLGGGALELGFLVIDLDNITLTLSCPYCLTFF